MEPLIFGVLLFALSLPLGLQVLARFNRSRNRNLRQQASVKNLPAARGRMTSRWALASMGLALSAGLLVVWLVLSVPGVRAQSPGATVGTAKSLSGSALSGAFQSGQEFTFFVSYSCAAIVDDFCESVVITDTLDPALEFLGVSSLPKGASVSQTGNDVVINLQNLEDGDSGIISVRVRFDLGTLPDTTVTNTTTIDAANANPATSNLVTVSSLGNFQMTVNKGVAANAQTGVIGSQFRTTYQLNICNPNNGVGGVSLLNPVITDTLPAEATPILPIPLGGTYISATGQIVWQAGQNGFPLEIPVTAGCFTFYVPVYFDEATPGVITGTSVTNRFQVSGNPADGPSTTATLGPVGQTTTLRDPAYVASLGKSAVSPSDHPDDPGVEELPGGPVAYILTYRNEGTLPINTVVVTDIIPPEIAKVTTVTVNSITAGQTITLSYELDNSGIWLVDTVTTSNATPDLSGVSGRVTGLRWEIGDVPLDAPAWSARINAFLDDTLTAGESANNCADGMGIAGGALRVERACAPVNIIDRRAIPRVEKLINDPGPHPPGAVVTYTLRVINDDVAHYSVVAPITLADSVPEELEVVVFEGGSYRPAEATDAWYIYTGAASAPVATLSPNTGNATFLRWQWSAPYQLPPNQALEVSFAVRVKKGTPPGDLDNISVILWDSATINPLDCVGAEAYIDGEDIDGDGNTSERGCQSPNTPTSVSVFLAMASEKFVLGELDGGVWNKDGLTVPGGRVDYRMIITNLSNVTTTNLVVYDIFPFAGDTGVVDLRYRASDWRPNLQADIEAPPGVPLSIQYSRSGNACRPELIPSGPPGCTDDWSSTPPADLTSVQAVRLDFCKGGNCLELPPERGNGMGGTMVLTWTMQAPNDAPVDPERAWNSFGFTAQGSGLTLLPAEPNKVGIRVQRPAADTINLGDYVWLDVYGQQNDGIQQPQEQGINGVRVELRDENGDPVDLDGDGQVDYRITGLDANGNSGYYLFVGLPDTLTYTLRFYLPVTYTLGPPLPVTYNTSLANKGGDDALDSDGIIIGSGPDYIQTGLITVTLALTTDLRWDQGLWLPTDYGDAPNSYNTRASSLLTPANAARHVILPGISLGPSVDAELDGAPTASGFGDDTTDVDDEDGVTFDYFTGTPALPTPVMIIGDTSRMTVSTRVPPAFTGYLNAWIDFNRDGDFADPGEQIATDRAAPAGGGNIYLAVPIPTTAISGTSYARFRFSTEAGLSPNGGARDGEVEDYPVMLVPGDFGDLPNVYGTLVASNGARHVITEINNPTLGSIVDDEFNGQPNSAASGDDTAGVDDEDGVSLDSEIIPGEVMTVTVTSLTAGLLNAWIDFNNDGDFNDAGERLASDRPLLAGSSIVLTATVPFNAAQNNNAYARFRYSSQAGLGPVGLALDGEVEDYAWPILPLDYGDLPSIYPTQSPTGARHVIRPTANPTLGFIVDAEIDGNPSANADGDDSDGSDDEDGVIFNSLLVPGKTASITVTVSGADGLLSAWIDFNADGQLDAGEQVLADIPVAVGPPVSLSFAVPASAVPGPANVRFRFSSQSDLTPAGLAADGEVEDYQVNIVQLDYGDLPDSYQTTDSANGPYHVIDPAIHLGWLVDAETDGQPSGDAGGDDTTGSDDEDGISFDTPLVPGEMAVITVQAVGSGNFSGRVDFNGNGSFELAERIFTNIGLTAGSQTLSFHVPAGAITGNTGLRFRYTTASLVDFTGPAPDGEIEDYLMTIVELDLGDLPDSSIAAVPDYPTTRADNGARHIITSSVYLGSRVDADDDGQPSALADGDDTNDTPATPANGSDDEDGVRFLTPLMPGETARIEVTGTGGVLNAWIDFNGDGDFNDAGEQIFTEQIVGSGPQLLTINVPSVVAETLYSRFRLTANTGQAIAPTGLAPNGEVEDYVLLSLGNQVWFDSTNDGLLNGVEQGLPGVVVTLVFSGTTTPIATTTTDSNGNYLFTGLTPGDYQVIIPAANFQPNGALFGYTSSTTTANADNDIDNDDNGLDHPEPEVYGISSSGVSLSPGGEPVSDGNGPNSNLTVDFGFWGRLSLGNLVWYDADNDGRKDPAESGLANVELALLDSSGNQITDGLGKPITTTTNASGEYLFTGLISGTYRVRIINTNFAPGGPLAKFISSTPTEPDPDSDIDNDDNGPDEPAPAVNGITSNVITITPLSEPDTPVDGDHNNSNLTLDFGFLEPLRLGNRIWIDEGARNGRIDHGESGVAGVLLNLLNAGGNPVLDTATGQPITTTTDANGFYLFTNLISGAYIVEVDAGNFQPGRPLAGYTSTTPTESDADTDIDGDDNGLDRSDPAASGIRSGPVTLTPGNEPEGESDEGGWPDTDSNLTVDFGFYRPARLGDYVWVDIDGNGQQDSNEAGLDGVTVNLWLDTDGDGLPDTLVQTTTTATSGTQAGYYEFTGLIPEAAYQVEFVLSPGYAFTLPDQDGDDVDSDAQPATGLTDIVILLPGENNPTVDAGLYRAGIYLDKAVAIAEIVPNQLVTFTITITNTGDISLNPVVLTDTLDAGLNYIPGSAVPAPDRVNGQRLVWNDVMGGAGLAPGASTRIVLLASATRVSGVYRNHALVKGVHPTGSITADDVVPVTVSDPAVDLNKKVAPPGVVAGIITFTIHLTNTGPSVLDQVPLFDQFAGPVQYIGGNILPDTIDNARQTLAWNDLTRVLGDMAPGQVFVIETVFRVTDGSATFSMTNAARTTNVKDIFGNTANENSDSVTLVNQPTAIELLYFEVQRQGNDVLLNWATAVEIDNFGFRLLRGTTGNRTDAVEIAFVPGQGLGTGRGAHYTYTDRSVDVNQTYTYWLVDVDFNGQETDHDSITILKLDQHSYQLYLPLTTK